jgi:hypothetical protein
LAWNFPLISCGQRKGPTVQLLLFELSENGGCCFDDVTMVARKGPRVREETRD